MAKIAEIVKIQAGYANFVNLREAFSEESENTDRMAMYRPTKAHRAALERLSRGLFMPNDKKFYLLSGSYGTGKSHLCLMLANILGKSGDDPSLSGFYENYSKLDSKRAKELKNVRSGGQYLVALCDYGSGRKFEDEVLRAIVAACEQRGIDISKFTEFAEAERLLTQWEAESKEKKGIRDFWKDFSTALEAVSPGTPVQALRVNLKDFKREALDQFYAAYQAMQGVDFHAKAGNLVSILRDLVRSDEFKKKFKGIAIFFDEFGTAILQNSRFDTAVMQAFMEEICQHEANVYFVGCIHKNFKDYAEKTNQATAAVMEARITQVPLANEGIEEIIGAIVETDKSSTIWETEVMPKKGIFDQLTPQCASLKLFPWIEDTNRIRERVLEDIFGVHPMALHCLLKLSSEVGSDVRSAFTFFSGGGTTGEPGSYAEFIEEKEIIGANGALNLYLPDQLYTFFEKELSPSSRELLDVQRNLVNGYAASLAALRKMENPELFDPEKEDKVAILRTILIFSLCGVSTTQENIEFGRYCIGNKEKKRLKQLLSELEKAGAVYLRKTSKTYELCATEGQDPVTLIDGLAEQQETKDKATVDELLKQTKMNEEYLVANNYNLPFTEDKRLKRHFVRGRELGTDLWKTLVEARQKQEPKFAVSYEGHAVYALCEDEGELKQAKDAVKTLPSGSNILVAIAHEPTPFRENLTRVLACRHLLAPDEAAKHPAQVIARIRDMLDDGASDGYLQFIQKVVNLVISGAQSSWHTDNGTILVDKPQQYHKAADMLCETLYTKRCQVKHPDLNLVHDEKWLRNSNTPLKQAVAELLDPSPVQIDNGNAPNHGEKRYLQKVLLNAAGALRHAGTNGTVTEFTVEEDPSKLKDEFPVLKELVLRLDALSSNSTISLAAFVEEMRLPPYGAGGTTLVLSIAAAVRAFGERLRVFQDSTHSSPGDLGSYDAIVKAVGDPSTKLELGLRAISKPQRTFVDALAKTCGAEPLAHGAIRSVKETAVLLRNWWNALPSVSKVWTLYPEKKRAHLENLKQVFDLGIPDDFEFLLERLPEVYGQSSASFSDAKAKTCADSFSEDVKLLNGGQDEQERLVADAIAGVFGGKGDAVETEKVVKAWYSGLSPDQRDPLRCDDHEEASDFLRLMKKSEISFPDLLFNRLPTDWGLGTIKSWSTQQLTAYRSKWEQAKTAVEQIKPLVPEPGATPGSNVSSVGKNIWEIEDGAKVRLSLPKGAKSLSYRLKKDGGSKSEEALTLQKDSDIDLDLLDSPSGTLEVWAVNEEGNSSKRIEYHIRHKQKQHQVVVEREDLYGDKGSFKFPSDVDSFIEVIRSIGDEAFSRGVLSTELKAKFDKLLGGLK
jgi:hypothetical protein